MHGCRRRRWQKIINIIFARLHLKRSFRMSFPPPGTFYCAEDEVRYLTWGVEEEKIKHVRVMEIRF